MVMTNEQKMYPFLASVNLIQRPVLPRQELRDRRVNPRRLLKYTHDLDPCVALLGFLLFLKTNDKLLASDALSVTKQAAC